MIDMSKAAEVREWEERIARFEGWTKGKDYNLQPVWVSSDFVQRKQVYRYSTSLPDLFRVLEKIKTKGTIVGTTGVDCWWVSNIGATKIKSYSLEQAIFQAICQYLRHYHPTTAEQVEDQERAAE